MSISRRIIDSARSGLDSIRDRRRHDPNVAEIEQLLAERQRAREAAGTRYKDRGATNRVARMAGSSAEARRARERSASKREARVKAVRARREQAAQAAQSAEFDKVKARMEREARARASAPPPPGAGARGRARAASGGRDAQIAKHYKQLDLPYGADFAAVKSAYRKLMRKYHPDLHGSTPQKQKAATELTKKLTMAYNELEQHLAGGPNRGK